MNNLRRAGAPISAVVLALGLTSAVVFGGSPAGGSVIPDPIGEAIAASAAPGHHWAPDAATYGVHWQRHVPVPMADGTVLDAEIASPTDPATGAPAAGPFPVLLTQTPYGKDTAGTLDSAAIGPDTYFVKRGYIDVAVDVRGTGASEGTFTLFDPKQTADGVALVNWAAGLPHSTGEVGLHGASYLGIDQMLTAGAVGTHSPLKAIFPIVSANDVYRDTAFMGGIPAGEFDAVYIGGLLPFLNLFNPVIALLENPLNLLAYAGVLLQHAKNSLDYNALWTLRTYLGGPDSYDTPAWHVRSPGNVLDKIVANGIPAYLVGGEYDLFQRGEPMNYAGLQNAWAGRPVTAPMLPDQPVTGRYQLLNGPYTHLGGALPKDLDMLELEWFDTWLRDADTGMANTPTPLHYYDLGTGHYTQQTSYPIAGATPQTFYFSGQRSGSALSLNDGTLTTAKPVAATGADSLHWLPVGSSICDRSIDQWAAGALSAVTGQFPVPVPCIDDDRLGQIGPTALTYTTAPFGHARTLAGPIAATIYARANRTETEWVVNIEDVAPDGTSKPLTQGALLGSARVLDPSRTWKVDGSTVMPYHPYTKVASKPVVRNALTRYDIEVFPTFSTIAAGHRLRVTVNSTDFPHLLPTPQQLVKLLGGVYQVQRTAAAPSSITVPLIG
jgi:putative CocE/NonD family hydrolase